MNINPTAAASVAGTSRAAARGGESDNQASEATRQQSTSETPGGKGADANAVEAGDQSGDRGGDGRQVLDLFEKSDEQHQEPDTPTDPKSVSQEGTGEHLDLQA